MKGLTAVLVLAGMMLGFAVAATDDKPRPLQVSATKVLNVPLFSAYGLPISDQDGDLFFHLGGSSYTDATIMKLSHSSSEPTLYKLPSDVQEKYSFYEFAVSASGEVWMLANAGQELLVVDFDSNGQVKGKTNLDLSLGEINITDFAAFEDDVLFVAGVSVSKAKKGHSFIGLFDGGTGGKIRSLRGLFSPDDTSKKQVSIHEGDAVAGDDGNIYLLHETRIIAISPAGQIVKRVSFEKPASSLLAIHLMVSSGDAAIWLRTPSKEDHKFETTYLIVDLQNGTPVGWYAPPPEVTMPATGFSRNSGFEFLQGEKGQWKRITAELR